MRSLPVFIIFSQKEKACMVERVVKFLACIVDNSEKFMINCALSENYKWKVRRQLTHMGCHHMRWYHGSTDTDNPLLFFFNAFNLNPQSTREEGMYCGKRGKVFVVHLNEYMGN